MKKGEREYWRKLASVTGQERHKGGAGVTQDGYGRVCQATVDRAWGTNSQTRSQMKGEQDKFGEGPRAPRTGRTAKGQDGGLGKEARVTYRSSDTGCSLPAVSRIIT